MQTPHRSIFTDGVRGIRPLRDLATRFSLVALFLVSFSVAGDEPQNQKPAKASSLPAALTDDPLLNSRFLFFAPDTLRRQTLR